MNKDRGKLLDSFYDGALKTINHNEINSKPTVQSKVVTYSLKLENIKYVELRSTYFSSKSGFINYLIEKDMKDHPEIVEMSTALSKME